MSAVLRLARRRGTRTWAVVAFAAVACAYAVLIEPVGDNEQAHYALVGALATGTPRIDDTVRRARLRTIDVVRHRGHLYTAKAPGLAAAALPPYFALRAIAPDRTTEDPRHSIWVLHLWACALPAILLLLVVRERADALVAGTGTAVAVTLGLATLVLPFASVLFSHVLAALLGFAAFALLWREGARSRPAVLAAAGVLAGLGVGVDYLVAPIAAALLPYAAARPPRLGRAAAYAVGAGAAIVPILFYNWWAFDSPFHVPYEGWHAPGEPPLQGPLGLGAPSFTILVQLVISSGGIGPLLFPGIAAGLLFYRLARPEALLIFGLTASFLLLNAAGSEPFGGGSPGPRYLVPLLPFLAIPLGCAFSSFPGAAVGVTVGGALFMFGATATSPTGAWDHQVLHRLATGGYVDSVLSFVGVHGAVGAVPFFVTVCAAIAAAGLASPRIHLDRRDLAPAAAACGGWLLLTSDAGRDLASGPAGALALLLLTVIGAAAVAMIQGWRPHASGWWPGSERSR